MKSEPTKVAAFLSIRLQPWKNAILIAEYQHAMLLFFAAGSAGHDG